MHSPSHAIGVGIDALLGVLWEARGTDLLLTAGMAPQLRVQGELSGVPGHSVLTPEDVDALLAELLNEEQAATWRTRHEYDFAFSWQDTARVRVNAYSQRGSTALALRIIPFQVPTMLELGLPPVMDEFVRRHQGLILVTGPTGSGKSTTLAAMIHQISIDRACHIITIEDPIEYVHPHMRSAVDQREVGSDTASFADALRAVLREDPDVLLVGEMRDLDSIRFALTIAETGHLVFATLHTNDTGAGARPDHRRLPRRAAGSGTGAAGGRAQRHRLPAADSEDRRRTGRRLRGARRERRRPQPDQGREDEPAAQLAGDRPQGRHGDLREVPVAARGLRAGHLQGRVDPQSLSQ